MPLFLSPLREELLRDQRWSERLYVTLSLATLGKLCEHQHAGNPKLGVFLKISVTSGGGMAHSLVLGRRWIRGLKWLFVLTIS